MRTVLIYVFAFWATAQATVRHNGCWYNHNPVKDGETVNNYKCQKKQMGGFAWTLISGKQRNSCVEGQQLYDVNHSWKEGVNLYICLSTLKIQKTVEGETPVCEYNRRPMPLGKKLQECTCTNGMNAKPMWKCKSAVTSGCVHGHKMFSSSYMTEEIENGSKVKTQCKCRRKHWSCKKQGCEQKDGTFAPVGTIDPRKCKCSPGPDPKIRDAMSQFHWSCPSIKVYRTCKNGKKEGETWIENHHHCSCKQKSQNDADVFCNKRAPCNGKHFEGDVVSKDNGSVCLCTQHKGNLGVHCFNATVPIPDVSFVCKFNGQTVFLGETRHNCECTVKMIGQNLKPRWKCNKPLNTGCSHDNKLFSSSYTTVEDVKDSVVKNECKCRYIIYFLPTQWSCKKMGPAPSTPVRCTNGKVVGDTWTENYKKCKCKKLKRTSTGSIVCGSAKYCVYDENKVSPGTVKDKCTCLLKPNGARWECNLADTLNVCYHKNDLFSRGYQWTEICAKTKDLKRCMCHSDGPGHPVVTCRKPPASDDTMCRYNGKTVREGTEMHNCICSQKPKSASVYWKCQTDDMSYPPCVNGHILIANQFTWKQKNNTKQCTCTTLYMAGTTSVRCLDLGCMFNGTLYYQGDAKPDEPTRYCDKGNDPNNIDDKYSLYHWHTPGTTNDVHCKDGRVLGEKWKDMKECKCVAESATSAKAKCV